MGLLTDGGGGWQYVSSVPSVPPPSGPLPKPNARDDFLAAIGLIPAESASQVRSLFGVGGGVSYYGSAPTPQLRRLVRNTAPALQRMRAGLPREFANPPILSAAQPTPEVAGYRQIARVLAAESDLALREGRPAVALQSGLDAVRLGGMVQRHGPLLHGLMGVATGTIGLRSIENAVESVDGETAIHAARELWKRDAEAPGYAEVLVTERDSGLYMLAALCRLSGRPEVLRALVGGSLTPGPPRTPSELGAMFQLAVTPKREILENYRRYMNAEIDRAGKPLYAQGPPPTRPSDLLNSNMLPELQNAGFPWAREQALRRVLATRLALRAYRLREGRLPPSLAKLVPEYLPVVPQDPFAPAPLIYREVNRKPLVYSRGPDGDDDGGRNLASQITINSDGDLASTRRPVNR